MPPPILLSHSHVGDIAGDGEVCTTRVLLSCQYAAAVVARTLAT